MKYPREFSTEQLKEGLQGLHEARGLRERYGAMRLDLTAKLPAPDKPLYLDRVHLLSSVAPYGNARAMHLLEGVYTTSDGKGRDLESLTKGLYGGFTSTGKVESGYSGSYRPTEGILERVEDNYIPIFNPQELYRTNAYLQ